MAQSVTSLRWTLLPRRHKVAIMAMGAVLAPLALAIGASLSSAAEAPTKYSSVNDVCYTPDGGWMAVADTGGAAIALVRTGDRAVSRRVAVASPWAVCAAGGRLYATEMESDTVAEVDIHAGRVVRRFRVGAYPRHLAVVPRRPWLLVGCTGPREVAILDYSSGRVVGRLTCPGQPSALAATPDGRRAVVTHLLPTGDATQEDNGATVSVFNLQSMRRLTEVRLPSGAAVVRGVTITPDGRWACVVHALGRYNLPTTQLDRGWVNTNALSVIDLQKLQPYFTVLLDSTQEGAADPWDVEISRDGQTLWITLSGVHELARVDFARLMRWVAGGLPDDHPLNRPTPEWALTTRNIWQEIKADPRRRSDLVNDLSALYVGDFIERLRLPGNGPRGLAISPDGSSLAVAQYFSGGLALCDTRPRVRTSVTIGTTSRPTLEREGERIFHDGTMAFQHWLSCATCHPEGRADGLNWDLLNDGIGNPKNTRSLLLAHRRGPMMSHAVRADLKVATTAGFRFILFRTPEPNDVDKVLAYIRSLKPLPSPRRVGPGRTQLSALALQGKALFESKRTKCATCHSGPLFTDQKLHDTGTRGPYDTDSRFVTPTLVELWRTPPYLHDGRATNLRDVLVRFNRKDKHGTTSHLPPREIDALVEYLHSL